MDRYQDIIPDWDAFTAEVQRPQRVTVRRNSLKAGDDFVDRLRERFPGVDRADWYRDAFRLDTGTPGKSVLHWRGEYYVQEESAMVPVTVLDPQPGESVLDMAAAPGGKTTQIAASMDGRGVVVANEKSDTRIRALQANVKRTAAACVATVQRDGRNLPEDEYDRILIDAPCTGEGNRVRRGEGPAPAAQRDSLVDLQQQLVEKGARMLADGGRLVYSTCTFAPEENEGVVSTVLDTTDLVLEDISLDIPHARGVTAFQDQTFPDIVERTVRIYPHHLRSGGMFVASFTR